MVATTLPESRDHDDFGIDLNPANPFPKPSRPYHMNQEERAECRKVLNEMLDARWAEPADVNCPMAAPMFFAPDPNLFAILLMLSKSLRRV